MSASVLGRIDECLPKTIAILKMASGGGAETYVTNNSRQRSLNNLNNENQLLLVLAHTEYLFLENIPLIATGELQVCTGKYLLLIVPIRFGCWI